jgi:enoyl-CoA hydratase
MQYSILNTDIQEGIAIISISRPEAMNALNTQFFTEINALLDEMEQRKDLRVLILTGEGKAFVAGADISEMVNMTPEEGKAFSELGQKTFNRISQFEIPVIGAINGFALGGGCELAMACDFRIASNKAKFGQPEVNLGLIPGYAGTQRLSRIAGLGNALFMLMTADMITAEDALRMGLVQKVTEPETLLSDTLDIAKKISLKGPDAMKKVKAVTRRGYNDSFDAGCRLETENFSTLFKAEGEEGMKAFLEKRKPNW